MKRAVLYCLNMILLILFIMLTSCMSSPTFLPVKGSGTPIDKNFKVSDFHGIDVSGGFNVILVQGNLEDLTLTAQENLFEHITVKVEQGKLRIYTENNIMSTKPMKVHISFKSIDNLKVSGGGDVNAGNFLTETTSFHVSGGSDIHVNVSKELSGYISGGGDVYYTGNPADVSVDAKGSSKIYRQ